MDLKDFKVTLPSEREIEDKVTVASDFAMANGVRFCEFDYDAERNILRHAQFGHFYGQRINCAYVGTSTVACIRVKKDEFFGDAFIGQGIMTDDKHQYKYELCSVVKYPGNDGSLDYKGVEKRHYAGDHAVGITPKFVNPEKIGMTLETEPNQNVGIIKIGDKTPTAPQSYVGTEMSEKLENLMAQGKLQQTGTFTVDEFSTNATSESGYDEMFEHGIVPKALPRFSYQGAEYVRKDFAQAQSIYRPDSTAEIKYENGSFSDGTIAEPGKPCWFKCEPYQAYKNQDGSITCLTAIMPLQLEVETKYRQIAREKFLGNERLKNMIADGADLSNIRPCIEPNNFSGGKFLNQVFLKEMLQSVGIEIDQNMTQQSDIGKEL